MEKIIFLDFDGVLNAEHYQAKLQKAGLPQWDAFGPVFDPAAVENLKRVLDAVPEAIVIINSSWKMEGLAKMKQLWKERGLPGKLRGVTPDYTPDLLNIDLENYDNIALLAGKGNDVKQWLEENAPQGCRYVIFDDVPDFLPEQMPYHICTDPRIGITPADALKAIAILGGK